ncbi:MAG: chromate transporter [Clostridia bacterium]|nr:chromate transporter [Clostridia bacterium]
MMLQLFSTFFKIGAFTFGGGYAMIPLIQKEMVENKHWISDEDILEIVAIAESTPGPIAINAATFIGYRKAGVWGSFAATFGTVLPSFVIITVIAYLLRGFADYPVVKHAFFGIRAGVLALILKAFVTMCKKSPRNTLSYCIMAAAFLLAGIFDFHVLLVLIACAVTGLLFSMQTERRNKK